MTITSISSTLLTASTTRLVIHSLRPPFAPCAFLVVLRLSALRISNCTVRRRSTRHAEYTCIAFAAWNLLRRRLRRLQSGHESTHHARRLRLSQRLDPGRVCRSHRPRVPARADLRPQRRAKLPRIMMARLRADAVKESALCLVDSPDSITRPKRSRPSDCRTLTSQSSQCLR